MTRQIGDLTRTEPAPGVQLYTLTDPAGAVLGLYSAYLVDGAWQVWAHEGNVHLGTEHDLPEVAMTISLHGIAP